MNRQHSILIVVAPLAFALLIWTGAIDLGALFGLDLTDPVTGWQRDAILGVWADDVAPSHRVRFEFVPTEGPTVEYGPVKVSGLDGKYTFEGVFGFDNAAGFWNYENFYPLRLNVQIDGRGSFVAVEMADKDHARLRLLDDINEALQPDVMNHPSTIRVHRTQ